MHHLMRTAKKCLLQQNATKSEMKNTKAIKCKMSPGGAFRGNSNLDLPICAGKH